MGLHIILNSDRKSNVDRTKQEVDSCSRWQTDRLYLFGAYLRLLLLKELYVANYNFESLHTLKESSLQLKFEHSIIATMILCLSVGSFTCIIEVYAALASSCQFIFVWFSILLTPVEIGCKVIVHIVGYLISHFSTTRLHH